MINNCLIYTPYVDDLNREKKMGTSFPVDKRQPDSIHKAVETLAGYFKREGHFDYIQYAAHEDKDSKNANAYIWVDEDWEGTFAVGAAGFRYLGDIGQIKAWSLQWVWFHPYYRCKGLLSGGWQQFVNKYGKDFDVAKPLSSEMKLFLKKMNHKF